MMARGTICAKGSQRWAAARIICRWPAIGGPPRTSNRATRTQRVWPRNTPRYDTKNRSVTPTELEQAVIASLDQLLPHTDAVIVLDQVEEADCGVVTESGA